MRLKHFVLSICPLLAWVAAVQAGPLTAFTYQGRLNSSNNPANGSYDFRTALFDAPEAGNAVVERVDVVAVGVTNGLFTLSLDFGPNVFDGAPRWLQIAVRTNGGGAFTPLAPRQALTPTPHALFSLNADQAALATTVPSGAISSAKLADGAITSSKITAGSVKPSHIDDGGAAAYESFLDTATPFSRTEPLPFAGLTLVSSNAGVAPSFTFTLDGAAFGTVAGFVGHEAISEPYEFVVEVIAAGASLNPDAQMGRQARVTFARNGRSTSFAGIVSGCSQGSHDGTNALYTFRVGPLLDYLALSTDYRIHQDITVPELVADLYRTVTADTLSPSLTGSHARREMVIQFSETDLNFFNRLLEDEGIFYFFRQDVAPTLVLGDALTAYQTAPNSPFRYYGNQTTNIPATAEFIRTFQKATRESTKTITLKDYDFTKPNLNMMASRASTVGQGVKYQFGSSAATPSALDAQAVLRLERTGVERSTLSGTANAPDLRPGYVFTLDDQTGSELGHSYLVTSVRHSAFRRLTNGVPSFYYGNQFEVIDAATVFRPAVKTPNPTALTCTAVVMGATNDARAYPDEHGRVKVQFHWDRYGAKNLNSSGWIRVTSPMAGPSHGALFLPRPGDEVLVEFIHGDPDRPVITGSFFNGLNVPPVALPAGRNVSAIHSESTTGGFNEIKFDDTAGLESFEITASRDFNLIVNNNANSSIDNDFAFHIGRNMTLSLGNNLALSANQLSLNTAGGIGIGITADAAFALSVGGRIRATAFQGDGSALSSLSASALTGTINDAQLPANLARLNGNNAFTGANTFAGATTFSNAMQSFSSSGLRLNDNDIYFRPGSDPLHGLGWYGGSRLFGGVNVNGPVLYGNGGGALGSIGSSANIALRWDDSRNVAIYGLLVLSGNVYANDKDIFLRNDVNHGLGWFGNGKPFGGVTLDGPVLYGYSGGGLGTFRGGVATNLALAWNNSGYVGIGNPNPTNRLMVVNARCDGSSWINSSDRNLKQDFAPVDALAVLAKVAALPVQTWSYQAQPDQKHLGPVAQDFHAAFGLGADNVSIATVDESGVALAAIQGLNRKLEQKDAEISELKQRLEQLEQLVRQPASDR